VSWFRTHPRTAWICGLTLLPLLLVYCYILSGLWHLRQEAQSEIDRIEPRVARLQGLIAIEEQLRESAQAVNSRVSDLVYPASTDQATVSAELQSNVRDLLGKAGLSVTNSQVLPVREQGNFDQIGVKLTVSGTLPALDDALAELAAYMPLVLVESLEVYPSRARRAADEPEQQLLTASVQVLSLRAVQ